MKIGNDILTELNELSPLLAGIEKKNVFSVPDGYFESLHETVIACISDEDVSLVNSFTKDNFFEVPQGYFENLSTNILNKIKNQQVENTENGFPTLSPELLRVQHINVFTVPAAYFDQLADNILTKVKPTPAKVLVMHPKRSNFFKYAAAAMITGVMALGVYKFTTHTNTTVGNTHAMASLDPSIQKGIKMNAAQFDQTLNNLSEDDISNYLENNVTDGDVTALSSNLEDSSLPSADDYLLDSKTLDNYLKANDTKATNN